MQTKKINANYENNILWTKAIDLKNVLYIAKHFHLTKKNHAITNRNGAVVVFIVQRAEVFNSVKNIFLEMLSNPLFEVYLLPIPRGNIGKRGYDSSTYNDTLEFCRGLGGGIVIDSYDRETGSFYELSKLNPNYIFLNVPYTEQYPEEYKIEKLREHGRVCFVPYGYTMSSVRNNKELYKTVFNIPLLANASFIFADNDDAYRYCKKKIFISELIDGKRLYKRGFPRFDKIDLQTNEVSQKLSILWIPRWTTSKQKGFHESSFFKYKDKYLEYLSSHEKDICGCIRPHPAAFDNYIKDGLMTEEEVNIYISEIDSMKNAYIDQTSDYMDSLYHADVLIADFSSIIVEYFMLGKPIIYLGNRNGFSDSMKDIIDTFYFADNWEEITTIIENIKDGRDEKKENRINAVHNFKRKQGNAGQRIAHLLLKNSRKHR